MDKKLKRRANLLYRLRKHGVRVDTKQKTIFIPYLEDPYQFVQAKHLAKEYFFNIQFIIT